MYKNDRSLINEWLDFELNFSGKTSTEAVKDLNDAINENHSGSRIWEMYDHRNGRGNNSSIKMRRYMLKIVLRKILSDAGIDVDNISTRKMNNIAKKLG